MSTVSENSTSASGTSGQSLAVDARLQSMGQLLAAVEESTHSPIRQEQQATGFFETGLASSRLGLATSLFLALRAKHAPTAAHSLRVAVLASAWMELLKVPAEVRDEVEIAGLLHDIGKIGVPDHILMKAGKLSAEEQLYMEFQRKLTLEIVSGCTQSPSLLEILKYIGAWYVSRQATAGKQGEQIPYGARLLSVVDAFDSMTTHSLYRTAMSRERAVAELFEMAGRQFDPKLVQEFSHFVTFENSQLEASTARRWLGELRNEAGDSTWQLGKIRPTEVAVTIDSQFHDHLLDGLADGVIYIDSSARITRWNNAAERITGISAEATLQHFWSPQLIGLTSSGGSRYSPEQCPVLHAMCRGERNVGRFEIVRHDGKAIPVDMVMTPVISRTQSILGITLVMNDVSNEISLEQRMQNLQERATRDMLTGVTNRAEFSRLFEQMLKEHLASGRTCSLIISDIDYFKRINDNYGHPVGDAALRSFAALLKKHCRPGDIVARYGGEEFLLLCPDCNNATAAGRAEQIRVELAGTPQSMIEGNCMNASFGVTELQHGDDIDSMLARADRALLQAKDNGRNQVVQLGVGLVDAAKRPSGGIFNSWLHWFNGQDSENLVDQLLATSVPLNITVEKLRGFIADHQAEILTITTERIAVQIDGDKLNLARRSTDRNVPYIIDVRFGAASESANLGQTSTLLQVTIRPKRSRDRRQSSVQERARQLFASLKSYLVAREIEA